MIEIFFTALLRPSILLAVTGLLLAGVSFQDHIQPDEALYLYTAKQWIVNHAPLYTAAGDSAQPAMLIAGGLFHSLFGNRIIFGRLLSVLLVLLSQWVVYTVSCRIYCRTAGLIAMSIFGIMMTWPDINNGFTVSPDIFIMACSAAGLYLLIRSYEASAKVHQYLYMISAGLFLGLAVLFKQTAVCSVAGVIAVYCTIYAGKQSSFGTTVRHIACILGACAILIASVLCLLTIQGTAIHDYLFSTWGSFRFFLPDSWYEWTKSCLFTFQRRNIIVMYPCILLFLMLRNKIEWKQRIAAGCIWWLLFEWIGVVAWGVLFEFDLTPLVLITSLMAGSSIAYIVQYEKFSAQHVHKNTALLIAGIVILGVPYETIYAEQRHSFLMDKKNPLASFGTWIAEQSGDAPILICAPWAAQAYLYADRQAPIRFVRQQYLFIPDLHDEFVAGLNANPPMFIVVPDEGEIPQWLRQYTSEGYKRLLHTNLWIRHNCKIYQREPSS